VLVVGKLAPEVGGKGVGDASRRAWAAGHGWEGCVTQLKVEEKRARGELLGDAAIAGWKSNFGVSMSVDLRNM
jgi:hypothetical protein